MPPSAEIVVLKIEFSLFAGLLLVATSLLTRAAAQGFEQALLSTLVEYFLSGVRAGKRPVPA
jgi:hypothetical protein